MGLFFQYPNALDAMKRLKFIQITGEKSLGFSCVGRSEKRYSLDAHANDVWAMQQSPLARHVQNSVFLWDVANSKIEKITDRHERDGDG